jgi:hypothetical protein
VDRASLQQLRAQARLPALPSFALGAGLAGPVAVGLGSEEALLLAASAQLVAACVGLALMRMPARSLAQASSGG